MDKIAELKKKQERELHALSLQVKAEKKFDAAKSVADKKLATELERAKAAHSKAIAEAQEIFKKAMAAAKLVITSASN